MQHQYRIHSFQSHCGTDNVQTLSASVSTPQGERKLRFDIEAPSHPHLRLPANAEPFVLALLIPCMEAGCDLFVDGSVDDTLLYNLNTQAIPLLSAQFDYLQNIRVHAHATSPTNTATHEGLSLLGMSCGLDALTAFAELNAPDAPARFHTQGLVFSDIGAFGKGHEKYLHDRAIVTAFAKAQGLPLFYLSSNMAEFYQHKYTYSFSVRNAAAAWALKPIARQATYASSIDYNAMIASTGGAMGPIEPLIFSMLSTPQLEVYSSGVRHTRTDKLKVFFQHESLHPYLNTCLRSVNRKGGFINCGHCKKCSEIIFRAMVLKQVDKIESTFNLAAFRDKLYYLTFKIGHNAQKGSEYSQDLQKELKKSTLTYSRSAMALGRLTGLLSRLV